MGRVRKTSADRISRSRRGIAPFRRDTPTLRRRTSAAARAGYSRRPLIDKLGIKPGQPVGVSAAPADFAATLGRLPPGAALRVRLTRKMPMIIGFVRDQKVLDRAFPRWKRALARDGALWIGWPKRSSGMHTDVDENVIRERCLAGGLVDVKVCAIDETWSGLKCVYRLVDR